MKKLHRLQTSSIQHNPPIILPDTYDEPSGFVRILMISTPIVVTEELVLFGNELCRLGKGSDVSHVRRRTGEFFDKLCERTTGSQGWNRALNGTSDMLDNIAVRLVPVIH